MGNLIYSLSALTALACAVLLIRGYYRMRHRLLFWSGLCFSGIFVSNVVLMIDRMVLIDVDLSTLRLATGLVALLPLLYGLIWEDD